MESFEPRPPIPTPDDRVGPRIETPEPVGELSDWTFAPQIVRNWAYQLTLLAIVVLGIFVAILVVGILLNPRYHGLQRWSLAVLYSCVLSLHVWLRGALRRGDHIAYAVQLVLSVLGLLAFPLGTLVHGYILSQWFKPETKEWFGMR